MMTNIKLSGRAVISETGRRPSAVRKWAGRTLIAALHGHVLRWRPISATPPVVSNQRASSFGARDNLSAWAPFHSVYRRSFTILRDFNRISGFPPQLFPSEIHWHKKLNWVDLMHRLLQSTRVKQEKCGSDFASDSSFTVGLSKKNRWIRKCTKEIAISCFDSI